MPEGRPYSFEVVGIVRRPLDLGGPRRQGRCDRPHPGVHARATSTRSRASRVMCSASARAMAPPTCRRWSRRRVGSSADPRSSASPAWASRVRARAARSTSRPSRLWVLAGVAALAGLVAIGLALTRQLAHVATDQDALRALGLGRRSRGRGGGDRHVADRARRCGTQRDRCGRGVAALSDRRRARRRARPRPRGRRPRARARLRRDGRARCRVGNPGRADGDADLPDESGAAGDRAHRGGPGAVVPGGRDRHRVRARAGPRGVGYPGPLVPGGRDRGRARCGSRAHLRREPAPRHGDAGAVRLARGLPHIRRRGAGHRRVRRGRHPARTGALRRWGRPALHGRARDPRPSGDRVRARADQGRCRSVDRRRSCSGDRT